MRHGHASVQAPPDRARRDPLQTSGSARRLRAGAASSRISHETAFASTSCMATRVGLRLRGLDPWLGAALDLLGALRRHGDEAELAVDFLAEESAATWNSWLSSASFSRSSAEIPWAACPTRLTRQRALRITASSASTRLVEVFVDDGVVVLPIAGHLARARRRGADGSSPRRPGHGPAGRRSRSSNEGGRMKTVTASRARSRTCAAPWTSTSSSRSTPSACARSSSLQQVP